MCRAVGRARGIDERLKRRCKKGLGQSVFVNEQPDVGVVHQQAGLHCMIVLRQRNASTIVFEEGRPFLSNLVFLDFLFFWPLIRPVHLGARLALSA